MNNSKRYQSWNSRNHFKKVESSYCDTPKCLSEPIIIGFMSVDVGRKYYSDLSQLRFLNSTYEGPTSMDLNHNIHTAVKRTTGDNEEKIDLLLRFLTDKHQQLSTYKVDFITYRRTLISIMYGAFEIADPIIVKACLFNGSVYLCSIESPQKLARRQNRSKEEEKFCAWGYKFEQYLLADQPNSNPDINKPVIENEEFSMYYYAKLGNFKLLYGAQIDGLLSDISTMETPMSNEYETDLNYLRNNNFVELKTNREIENFKQKRNFKRFKLLGCWCQCYLANLKGLYVGFRNDRGIIQRLQWFDIQGIVSYCKNEWNPQIALNFLDNFLNNINASFAPYRNQTGPITLQFQLNTDKTISVIDNCNNDILPSWYTKSNINFSTFQSEINVGE